jgi:signal transduction histidine kinase
MPEGAKELITAARDRTFRMSTLIDELLSSAVGTLSNEDSDQVSSQTAINEAIDRLKPVFEAQQIDLRLPPVMPHVIGDHVRLRETFYNLLSNAAKFIDKRPGRISVDVEMDEESCTFTIADNGPGIPREELERIFVPFRRLAMHRDKPGSGLGLYFTKNMVEHQGGRIWVESELGSGSRFYIWLKR